MKDISARLMRYYNIWLRFGKDEQYLIDDAEEIFLITNWFDTKNGRDFKGNPELSQFVDKSRDSIGSEYSTQFYEKGSCANCGETYKKENLSYCVNCKSLYCYHCVHDLKTDDEGAWLCNRCNSVLVG